MVDFRKLLSPKTRGESKVRLDRMLAFQEMDRKAMAMSLVSASRTLIDSGLFHAEHPASQWGNDEWAMYRCIPALAMCLDPTVDLRVDEIAKPQEQWDPLVKVKAGDAEDLLRSIDLIIGHTLFLRAQGGPEKVREAADFLQDDLGRGSAIEVAVDTVSPGRFPERAEPDTRAPLQGVQLIATHGDHDRVQRYAECEADLADIFRAAVSKRNREELSAEDEALLRGLRSWHERLDFDALSIQTCDGTVLCEQSFIAEDAPAPAMW